MVELWKRKFLSWRCLLGTIIRRDRAFLVLFLGIAAIKLTVLLVTAKDPYLSVRTSDELYHHEFAVRISQGQLSFGKPFFTNPLFSYVLALLYRLAGHEVITVRLLNTVLALLAIVFTYLTSRRLLPTGRSRQYCTLIPPLLLGMSSSLMFYEMLPDKTTLVVFLCSLSFWALYRAQAKDGYVSWIGAGACSGLLVLAHSIFLVIAPAAAAHIVLNSHQGHASKQSMRRSALVFLLYICGFLAAISPATLHNYLQDGRFVLVTSSFGQNFYLGNHAGNQRGVYTSPEFAVASIADESDAFRKEAELRTGKTLNSGQVSTFWFKQGLIESAGMPKTALKRIYSRIRLSLGNQEVADSRTYGFYQEKFCILRPPMLGFAVISILGLAGAVSRITDRHIAALSFTVLFVVAGLSLLHVFGRFRAPLAVPLSLLAPYGIGFIMAALRKKDAMSIVLKAAFLTFLVWFTVGQVMVDKESHFVDYFNQGNHYYRQGNYELAVQEYEKAWSMKPGDHPSVIPMIMSLSDLYVSMGRMEQAAILIERAVKRYPSSRVLRSKAELFGIQPI